MGSDRERARKSVKEAERAKDKSPCISKTSHSQIDIGLGGMQRQRER